MDFYYGTNMGAGSPKAMSAMQTNLIETVIIMFNHLCLVLPINLKKGKREELTATLVVLSM